MSPEGCHRVRDALAAMNVWGDAALLEHAKECEVCARELAVLKKQREFRDAFPTLSSIADESRRAPRATSTAGETRSRRHLVIMIATVIAIVAFYIEHHLTPGPSTKESSSETAQAPRYRIANLENALFTSKVEGTTVRSSMTRGVAAFYVEPMNANQRFLLTLPDGELEVKGTRFVVSIENDKTKVVDVAEGTVALRLQGREEIILSEGQRWPGGSGRPSLSFMNLSTHKDAGAPDAPKPSEP